MVWHLLIDGLHTMQLSPFGAMSLCNNSSHIRSNYSDVACIRLIGFPFANASSLRSFQQNWKHSSSILQFWKMTKVITLLFQGIKGDITGVRWTRFREIMTRVSAIPDVRLNKASTMPCPNAVASSTALQSHHGLFSSATILLSYWVHITNNSCLWWTEDLPETFSNLRLNSYVIGLYLM